MRVQQAAPASLFVVLTDGGRVRGEHTGTSRTDWQWNLDCTSCGDQTVVRSATMARLQAETAMLRHARRHETGERRRFGYGWTR